MVLHTDSMSAPTLFNAAVSSRILDYFQFSSYRKPMPEKQQPSNEFLLEYLTALSMVALLCIITFKRLPHHNRNELVQACGVSLRKVARSVKEIKRKGFHIAGLLVPLVQLLLLRVGWTTADCARLCWVITIVGTSCDYARLHVGVVARNWPLRSILREHEHRQLTGGCYFSLGCTLAICKRPRASRTLPYLSPFTHSPLTTLLSLVAVQQYPRRRSRWPPSSSSSSAT